MGRAGVVLFTGRSVAGGTILAGSTITRKDSFGFFTIGCHGLFFLYIKKILIGICIHNAQKASFPAGNTARYAPFIWQGSSIVVGTEN
jgi:hypothetical protein